MQNLVHVLNYLQSTLKNKCKIFSVTEEQWGDFFPEFRKVEINEVFF